MPLEEPAPKARISLTSSADSEPPSISRRRVPDALVNRYESIRFLGEGGMGTVYRARDPRLGRTVAVKLLKGDDADLWPRFIAEARAQANIQHENVCHVYDAGDVDGQPFIAMQFIDGEPLSNWKDKLTLEQKVRVLKQVSMAVHEANRLGIIHRDIKPGNVLCEKLEDGTIKPYIMDFGLAREVNEQGRTQTGAVIGTPAYMPPEQAKGDVRSMDRRSDVYSLGATLYDVIANRPPFVSENAWSLLMAVAYEEPPALGKVRKGVPEDLETIVMKAIEREPSRRYDSARALAEDLQRYLDGEPIWARRSSWAYILWKKAKKNKLLTAIAMTVFVSAVVLAIVWGRARKQAVEQARLAQQLGEGIKEMELFLRAAYELPVHDVERERDVVRDRLKDIEERMAKAGKAGEGSGNYAIGRGHLALGNPEKARVHLEMASKSGYASADLEYALGLSYGELFRRAVDETKRITNEEERKKKSAELETSLRDPALLHLRAALSARIEVPVYAEGLIALYEGKNDEALTKAKAAFEKAPWMYEAKKLEGDALYAEGSKYRHDAAFDYDKMKSYFDPAAEAYRVAADMARSDPETHRAECELWEKMGAAAGMKGAPSRDAFDRANVACLRAVQSSSRDGKLRVQRAIVLQSALMRQVDEAGSPDEKIRLADEAVRVAREAVEALPNDAMAHYAMAGAQQMRSYALQSVGKDASMQEAIAAFERALSMDPRFTWAISELGDAYGFDAEKERLRGRDPTPLLRKAIRQYEHALETDPKFALAAGRRLVAYRNFLEYDMQRGRDSQETLRALLDAVAQYEKLSPGPWLVAYWNVRVNVLHAQYENTFGRSPMAALEAATNVITKFAGPLPDDYWFLLALVDCRLVEATYGLRAGNDISAMIEDARRAVKKGAEIKSTMPLDLRHRAAAIEVLAMTYAKQRGQLDKEHFDRALGYVQNVSKIAGADALLYALHAEVLALRAAWTHERRDDPTDDIQAGLASVDAAVAMYPRMTRAVIAKGNLLLVRSHRAHTETERREAASRAKSAFEEAFRENPLLAREHATSYKDAQNLIQ
ncbi:MAG: protein kinase [Polyangiaceae bacterium]|nr:protein kinase [Polyangiaceae bacterium]